MCCVRRCMVDSKPRKLTVEDYRVLNSCAEMVVRAVTSYSVLCPGRVGEMGIWESAACFRPLRRA
jgi:hypothetical protein